MATTDGVITPASLAASCTTDYIIMHTSISAGLYGTATHCSILLNDEVSPLRQNFGISAGVGGAQVKPRGKEISEIFPQSVIFSSCCSISRCIICESLSFCTDKLLKRW